jgi:N-carbamoyl-L-amino-acid hydrolase
MFEFEDVSRIEPVPCHPDVVNLVDKEAARLGLNSLRMPSGAAHDAQILAGMTRAGMIFVPSKEGRSHSPAEWTTWADIEAGANLALHSLIRLTRGD